MRTKHHLFAYLILLVLIAVFVIAVLVLPELKAFSSPDYLHQFILSFGFLAFLVYIFLVISSVPFIIPSTPVILAGGYIFGLSAGFVLSLIGMVLGSTLAFYLTRLGGRPLLESWADPHHIKHFDKVFKKRGSTAVLISYAIPVFPTDVVSLFLGLTKMKYKLFLTLVILGHIPRLLILILLGSDFYTGFSLRTLVVLAIALGLILIAVFREKIKRVLFKELRAFRQEIGWVEAWFDWKKSN